MENTIIKKVIEDLLSKFSLDFELEIINDEDIKATRFLIKTDEPNVLIGYKGANLSALSHIIKRIVDNKITDKNTKPFFIIDVNNYQENKIEEIKTSAYMLAERAKYFKSSVEMNPLPSYERMIVHSLFADSADFETQSQGEGSERRVIIRYIGEK